MINDGLGDALGGARGGEASTGLPSQALFDATTTGWDAVHTADRGAEGAALTASYSLDNHGAPAGAPLFPWAPSTTEALAAAEVSAGPGPDSGARARWAPHIGLKSPAGARERPATQPQRPRRLSRRPTRPSL